MTPSGMVPMRLAATLVHAVPGVRLRLGLAGGPPLIVGGTSSGQGVVPAHVFRSAVARACRMADSGVQPIPGCTPAVEVGVPGSGQVHPGGIVRVALDRVELTAFVTTLAPLRCGLLCAERAGDRAVRCYHDEATDVTLVHVEAPPRERAEVLDVMEDLLAGCLTEELVGV